MRITLVLATRNVPQLGENGLISGYSVSVQTHRLFLDTRWAAKVPTGLYPEACFWDTANPYDFFLRIDHHDDHDYLIFGGEDHKTGQVTDTQECYHRLEQRLRSARSRPRRSTAAGPAKSSKPPTASPSLAKSRIASSSPPVSEAMASPSAPSPA